MTCVGVSHWIRFRSGGEWMVGRGAFGPVSPTNLWGEEIRS